MDWLGALTRDFALYWLLVARVGGFWATAPVLGSQAIPGAVKAPAVAVLALAMVPVARGSAPQLPTDLVPYAGLVARELALGLTMGFLARLVLVAVEVGGQLIDVQLGFSVVSVLDPAMGEALPLWGGFLLMAALLVFLLVGGDHLLIGALAASYRALPVGAPLPLAAASGAAFAALGWACAAALALAAPLLGVGLIVNLALGLLGRAAPQLNVFATALPVQVLVGIATLMAAAPAVVAMLAQLAPQSLAQATRLFGP
jgi:flagellar biosynthetic protein FliR